MNRNVSAQISYDRLNKGVDIRNPSTANFLVDSTDRALDESPADFTITPRGQNLFTGFFTRFGLTEICLTWNIPNISEQNRLRFIRFSYNGTVYNATIKSGFYNVKECLDAMVVTMNAAVAASVFSIIDCFRFFGCKSFKGTSNFYFINDTTVYNLANHLGFPTYATGNDPSLSEYFCVAPDLRFLNYIDFTSPQLSSQQDVKDSSTAVTTPDSIYRWVFANDSPNTYDTYGYPILQSYKPFAERRYLAFPKQIRWDPAIPLGQVQFRVLDNNGNILQFGYQNPFEVTLPDQNPFYGPNMEFNMLMLVSEV
jgi:hypothetical protein